MDGHQIQMGIETEVIDILHRCRLSQLVIKDFTHTFYRLRNLLIVHIRFTSITGRYTAQTEISRCRIESAAHRAHLASGGFHNQSIEPSQQFRSYAYILPLRHLCRKLVGAFQVQIHQVLHHRLTGSDTLVEKHLGFRLGQRGALDGCRMGNNRIDIKLSIIDGFR